MFYIFNAAGEVVDYAVSITSAERLVDYLNRTERAAAPFYCSGTLLAA